MPYYRFENMEQIVTNPHLSTGTGGIVNGHYLSIRNNNKAAGTGSQLHYHPNELLIFLIAGKLNAVVGKDQRIVTPGTFIHVPPNARHSMKATEDGPVSYLYCKDNTWTLAGVAADEAPPETAPSLDEIRQDYESGKWPGQDKAPEKSEAIIEGLGECYYPVMDFAEPEHSGRISTLIDGERLTFGYFESPPGYLEESDALEHERFMYVISGSLETAIDGEKKDVVSGDLMHIPRHMNTSFRVGNGTARYVIFQPNTFLESKIAE